MPHPTYRADCRDCPRLASFLDRVKADNPSYFCKPVPPFGPADAALVAQEKRLLLSKREAAALAWSAFFEVKNVLDKTNLGAANNAANSISSVTGAQNGADFMAVNSTGLIYAGTPRTFYGGMRLSF
mgnify:CR=1 FL=1